MVNVKYDVLSVGFYALRDEFEYSLEAYCFHPSQISENAFMYIWKFLRLHRTK
jgi:hypothetical protein